MRIVGNRVEHGVYEADILCLAAVFYRLHQSVYQDRQREILKLHDPGDADHQRVRRER